MAGKVQREVKIGSIMPFTRIFLPKTGVHKAR